MNEVALVLGLVAIVLGGYAWSLRTRKWPERKKCWWDGCDGVQISKAHHFCHKHSSGGVHVAPPMLHLLDKATERPLCGASIREAWTIIPETATCPECRKQGDMSMLQWYVNNR